MQNIHQYIEGGLRPARGERQSAVALRIEASVASADATNSTTQASKEASTLALLTDITTSRAQVSAAGAAAERPAVGEVG